jgi:uracil-DNA glycosylase family 4
MSSEGAMQTGQALACVAARVHRCRACPRLVAHRERAAAEPPRRYLGERYWARPLSGFGDPSARVLVVGLAPAAHGGNRTGRFFTGDESGRFLFRAMHDAGFANQATSLHRDDGLALEGAFVTAVVRCPPPGNKPNSEETARCLPYLAEELTLLPRLAVVVALGAFAWRGFFAARRALGMREPSPRPQFGHGVEVELAPRLHLLGSYHPSQQNTFTGRLTQPMLRAVFERAGQLAKKPP